MDMIADSVGTNGCNQPNDVAIIQTLINRNIYLIKDTPLLKVDNNIGDKTVAAIREYQKKVLKLKDSNGLIEPNRTTIKWMLKTARVPRPQSVDTFIIKTLPIAKKVKSKYQIPVSVLIAQAAIDSEWGHRSLTETKIDGAHFHLDERDTSLKRFAEEAEEYGHFLKTNPKYIHAFAYKQQPLIFAKKLQESMGINNKSITNGLRSVIKRYHLAELDQ